MLIKQACKLKKDDKFIHNASVYRVTADYFQCCGMGHMDFGEYGIVAAKQKTWTSYVTVPYLHLYEYLPVIVLEDNDVY